jgi:hypothetical protein
MKKVLWTRSARLQTGIFYKNDVCLISPDLEEVILLGIYSKKAKAYEVIDEIHEILNSVAYGENLFKMGALGLRKLAKRYENIYYNDVTKTIIYEMPERDEGEKIDEYIAKLAKERREKSQ